VTAVQADRGRAGGDVADANQGEIGRAVRRNDDVWITGDLEAAELEDREREKIDLRKMLVETEREIEG